ncbi:SHC SH2 domain-binding protein 1 homolog B-like [Orbicella faveolata]|uniref:SHC SH2 domain-binding protein 1 homolog B-like n=1 Tax=Orbicella faveolata TaxID=48498 RepID=UPI0009E29199|nr:SHC SH2 domain-binding protein 1 homolog B-like [Orbicella faveolata]
MSGSQLPMIFQTADLVFEDRVSAYKNDILGLCKPHEVSERIAKYIAQNVEASGWQAVWRSTPKSSGQQQPFDVVVEVSNVNASKLTAEISICEPVVTDCLSLLDAERVNAHLFSHGSHVPLVELYPVYDESGQQDETALAIEHVRFFYENIWREWDEDDDGEYCYAARHLDTRIQLYYDIQNGSLPKDLVNNYKDTYEQYKQKLAELKQLQEKMGGSDLGEELDEMDVLRCAQMSEMCESLVHSLQIIENPQMRYLLATVSPKMTRQGPRGNRPEGDEPVTYIVAPKLRAGMLKTFQDNTVVEHLPCLGKALRTYYNGDTIVVYPGRYNLDGRVYQLADSVHITGMGNFSEIVVFCSDNDEFTMEFCASNISIKNITFEQEGNDSEGIVVVKNGRVTFDDCDMRCETNGVSVESNGELVMRQCKVHGAKSAGITVSSGATLHLENTKLFDNGEFGKNSDLSEGLATGAILLEAKSDCKKTKAILSDNYITNNHCYGICVKKDNDIFTASDDPEYGVELEMTNNVFEENMYGDIGHFLVDTD